MKKLTYNIKFLTIGLTLFTSMQSCDKTLDMSPTTEYAYRNYFASTSQAYALLYGAYYQLQTSLNQEFIYYGEARSDNVTYGGGALSNTTLSVIENALDGNLAYSDWGNFYSVIKQANLLIKNVPLMREEGINVRDADYNKLLGQALGLRALTYFYLVRIWGDVPFIIEPVEREADLTAFRTPRLSKQIIYQQISTDLIMARALLPTTNDNNMETRGMLTRGAIDAMQTDFYMWRNMPDSALITSARLIDAAGEPTYATYKLAELYNPNINYRASGNSIDNAPYSLMFTEGLSEESIFEVIFNFEDNNTSNIFGIYGNVNAQLSSRSEFAGSFLDTDLRVLTNFRSTTQIYKFFPKSGFNQATENDKNVIIYRLADIMLLRAEALNATGQRAPAFLLVNKIRERAGLTAIDASEYGSYTEEEAQDVILTERQKELCFEGKRWFDLVRTGKAIEVMQPINGMSNPNNLVWPINLNVLRRNPSLEQNEFYK